MKKERTETNPGRDLRRQAEERLKYRKDNAGGFAVEGSKDALALVHELQVHQIELEMQNEELKRTKLEAEDALAKYSDLYDFAPIGLFNLNEQGIILEVNLAGATLLGVERRNLTNRSFSKFVALKDRASFDDFRKKTFETSVRQTCELSLLRDGVPIIYARIVGTATSDLPPGERECRIAIVDITESKKAESILNRYQLISKHARDIIFHMSRDGSIIEANEAAIKAYGYTRDELLSKNILDLRPRDAKESAFMQMQLADARGLLFETYHMCKDGSVFPVEVSSIGTIIEGKRVLLSIIRDISERKKAEEALRQAKDELELKVLERTADLEKINKALQKSEAQYRRLVELSPDAICVLKSDKILFANDALVKLLGGSNREEFLGRSILHFVHEDHKEMARDRINKILEMNEISETAEYKFIRMDGRIVEAEVASTPIVFESYPAVLSLGRDVTARKQAEAELRAAKDAAEAAVLAKSDFMANMSHEIRTPMNAVIGMTSLLLDDENLALEHRDFIETIRTSGDALMVIINDILDFSKMDRQRTVLEEQPFSLRNCIEESIDLVAVQAKEKRLNLSYVIDENVPETILGDPARLRQVLINLLNNASKFTNKGDVKLSVSCTDISKNHEIHFAIQDTGIGISADNIEKLFKPFSQVETSTTRNYGGTGLGLAISKKLVELMGGRIWVESVLGKGSTFHFTINTLAALNDAKPFMNIIQPQLVGKHVLIVDNNKINRHILGLQAYSWGMVPLIASSGRDALSWIKRGDDFDLVILDGSIEDDDGLLLAKEMREFNRALPLVLLTSLDYSETSDIFTAVLVKPIKLAQLYVVLLELFAKKPDGGSSHASDDDASDRDANDDNANASVHSPRILLAEDNTSNQKVVMAMLKRLGYRADPVANGIEALQALGRQHYDIVLMDVRMPEIGGLDATKIIRERWPENGPKVIAITAYALEGDMKKCLDSGMDGYISKPVKMSDLEEVLNKYRPAFKE
ncbi:MAG: PAS domain S-box protein [Methanothrix sp.]|nr:MAG: PAS domain S-box protein [Methanothrix sp.]